MAIRMVGVVRMCVSIGHAGVSVHGLLTGLRELAGLASLAEGGRRSDS